MFQGKLKIKQACPRCGYTLEALPDEGVCPECGRTYSPDLLRRAARYQYGNRRLVCIVIATPVAALIGLELPELIEEKFYETIFGLLVFLLLALLPVLSFGLGFALPMFVLYSRHLRACLLYGNKDRVVVMSVNIGAGTGLILSYSTWFVLLSAMGGDLNRHVFYILAPGSTVLATYLGSIFGERIGLHLIQSRS